MSLEIYNQWRLTIRCHGSNLGSNVSPNESNDRRFKEVLGNKHRLQKVTLSQIVAIVLAAGVILTHFLVLFLAINQIISADSSLIQFASVIISALIIWAITFRFDSRPNDHELVARENAPTLHHIVQRVATTLDIQVSHVLLTDQFTASYSTLWHSTSVVAVAWSAFCFAVDSARACQLGSA